MTVGFPSQSTKCKLDVYTYPFDTQNCSIGIGTWISDTTFISLGLDQSEYSTHPVWQLKSLSPNTENEFNRIDLINLYITNVAKSDYFGLFSNTDLSIDLTLKRSPLYIMINGILPCFILNIVILVAFGMPFATQIGLCKLF
jgi:hypothetical protein